MTAPLGTPIPTITLNDGHSIPQLGLGTWPMSDAEAADGVSAALEIGYRLVDTAAKYENEVGIGRGLAASGVPRDELHVTTKLRGSEQGYESAKAALARSLERLGLDYVDTYLIHWPLPRIDAYVDSYRAMVELKEQGLIRSVGVSNFKRHHLERLIDEVGVVPAVNQIQLSPALARKEIRAFHDEIGVVTQAWSPLGRQQSLVDDPVVGELAEEYGRTPAQIMLRWEVQQGIVTIPKSSDPERQSTNASVFDFELSDDAMARLAALDRGENAAGDSDRHEEF
ncbi:MAG TPA: aldo/keto reductase [Nocardioidaceae bacterium]|nr:aldo/keto reductase [Nocardioidaceae bacterium]